MYFSAIMTKLGVFLFIYYLQIKLCQMEATSNVHKGFCKVHFTVEELHKETYKTVSHYSWKQVIENGYYTWKHVPNYETHYRNVPKTVTRSRIECCAGYKNVTVHENIYDCEPICDPPCLQGHCTMPGNCTCFHGYKHQESNKCIPHCDPSCINGLCTAPGHCECEEGYDKLNSSYCEPHCSQNCNHGLCHKPEECLCNTGYKKSSKNPFDCEPICDVACVNATCVSYNECNCWVGYGKISTQSNACKPICELECLNGDCTAPNTCTCHEGFSKNDSLNICEPDCANCTFGFCIEPNMCKCFENYTRNDQGICEPICNDCSNGVCISPYQCECLEGYEEGNDSKCIPYCEGCENGQCIEPNTCSCFEGYENSSGSCFPFCEYGCFGGDCIAPNNCSCYEVIELSEKVRFERIEENVCFPLQQNGTSPYENITPKRFLIHMMKTMNSIGIYDLYLSTVHVKVNCSYEKTIYNTSSGSENNSSNSIECSNIKNAQGLYMLCIWNSFHSDIQSLYAEYLSSVLPDLNTSETEDHYTKSIMTVLLPTDMMSEDESCYLCPSLQQFRTKIPGNFRIPLIPCELDHLQNEHILDNLEGIGIIGVAILAALILITSGLVIFFRKYRNNNYFVDSSQQLDQIAFSMNQED